MMHGSVAADLVAFATRDHPLFDKDNRQVHFDLEKALQATAHALSSKPFQHSKDGRGAHQLIVLQGAKNNKWESKPKCCDALLTTGVWKGNTDFELESFVDQHRVAHVDM